MWFNASTDWLLVYLVGSEADKRSSSSRLGQCSERDSQLDYQSQENQGHLPYTEHV